VTNYLDSNKESNNQTIGSQFSCRMCPKAIIDADNWLFFTYILDSQIKRRTTGAKEYFLQDLDPLYISFYSK
jgi:hypothetical protein